ncbi:unnamed protein product, partial [Prorocentrum cordatum]
AGGDGASAQKPTPNGKPPAGAPPRPPPGGFGVGERVRYFSDRHGKWVDTFVQRVNRDGEGALLSYDLSMKPQAEPSKVRAAAAPDEPEIEPPPPAGCTLGSSQVGPIEGILEITVSA